MKSNTAIVRALVFLVTIVTSFTAPLFAEAQSSNVPSQPDTQPQINPAEKLLELAKREFVILRPADEKFFRAVANGGMADYSAGSEGVDNPTNAQDWAIERVLTADRITWLCTNPRAGALVTHRGLMVKGVRVEGRLDLQYSRIHFPLVFVNSVFLDPILLTHADLQELYLDGTYTKTINAAFLRARDVALLNGFKAEGEVSFADATIDDELNCNGAQFINKDGNALVANGLKSAAVFLGKGFRAEGQVSLVAATIGTVLSCTGGKFINASTNALIANKMKVGGDVFLRDGFIAEGEVSVMGATISGDLDCGGAQIVNKSGNAFSADGLKVDGRVSLEDGFTALGKVCLAGAMIGGNLECDGAHIANKSGIAFKADGLRTTGSVFLRNGFKTEGEVNLIAATIGRTLDFDGAQLINAGTNALCADGLKVAGSVFLRDGFTATGEVRLVSATIGGDLESVHSQFINAGGIALNAAGLKITGILYLANGFEVQGKVNLASAKVGTLLNEQKSWPTSGGLLLDGFVFDAIGTGFLGDADSGIRWLHLQPADQFLPQPYEQLATALRKSGREDDAQEILIAKNRDRAQRVIWSHPIRWWYWLLDATIRYGYSPWRAFWGSWLFIGLGWILFACGKLTGLMTQTKDEARGGEKSRENYPKFNALVYSLETFVPLINLRVAEYWLPNANLGREFAFLRIKLKIGSVLRVYLWVHIIMGWVLTTLWVGALTGLIKT